MDRKAMLEKAQSLCTADREQEYGDPKTNFTTIAKLWSVYLGKDLSAEQVGMCMMLVKVARQKFDKTNVENYIDIAGYAACVTEIATEGKRNGNGG
jgi:hypothetical protein